MAQSEQVSGSLKKSQRRTAYMMMSPAATILIVFLGIPFIMAVGFSFTNQPLVPRVITETDEDGNVTQRQESADFIGLDNYERLLRVKLFTLEPIIDEETGKVELDEDGNTVYERARGYLRPERLEELTQFSILGTRYLVGASDAKFWFSLWNVIKFVIIVVPIQTSLALGLAMLVNQKLPGIVIFRTLYFSPVVTSMAILAVVWFFLYNPSAGFFNTMLGVLSLGPYDWLESSDTALIAIIILSIWQGVGFQMVIFLAGLQEIPGSLYEASSLDGANTFQQFRHITIPSLKNTTVFVVISTTILAFKLFTQVDVMTFGRGGPDNATITPTLHMVNEGFREAQRVGYSSTIAVVFVMIVISISLIQNTLFRERGS